MGNKNKLTSVYALRNGKFQMFCRQCTHTALGPERDSEAEAKEDRILHRKYIHNPEFLHARYLSDHGIEIKRLY